MVDDDKVEAFIAHYASQYYDPVKAHEYYMRTRKLKGRFSTRGMNQKQKEAWTYVKAQVGAKKKAQTLQARSARDSGIAAARQRAKSLRLELSKKLKKLSTIESKAERERIANELRAVIARYRAKYEADKKAAATSADRAMTNEYRNVKRRIR